jgi:hypothetical protein
MHKISKRHSLVVFDCALCHWQSHSHLTLSVTRVKTSMHISLVQIATITLWAYCAMGYSDAPNMGSSYSLQESNAQQQQPPRILSITCGIGVVLFLFFTVNWDGEFAISALPWQFLGPSLKSLSAFFGYETRHNFAWQSQIPDLLGLCYRCRLFYDGSDRVKPNKHEN